MAQRQCEKCGETVHEAKAFCPSCGEAFVEESKRTESSVFESMEGTMQLGNTMYNQLLSDMGLNLKEAKSVAAPTEPAITIPSGSIPAPSPGVQPAESRASRPVEPDRGNKWLIILAIGGLAALLLALIVVMAAGYIFYRSQGG